MTHFRVNLLMRGHMHGQPELAPHSLDAVLAHLAPLAGRFGKMAKNLLGHGLSVADGEGIASSSFIN